MLTALVQNSDGLITPTPARTFKLAAGYVILDVSSSTGGVTYDRQVADETRTGAALDRDIHTHKHVDNVDLVAACQALADKARYAIKSRCANTALGAWCADDKLPELLAAVRDLRAEARALNLRAAAVGSQARVRVGAIPLRVEPDHEAAAREIARSIVETMQALKAELLAGDLKRADVTLRRAVRLDRLAVGVQRDSILLALDAAKQAREQVKDRIKKQSQTPESAGGAVRPLLDALDACADLYADLYGGDDDGSGA